MKRWSTTPVSKGLATKSLIVATAVLMAVSAPLAMMPRANADKYDDQINALQREIDQYQNQAGKLRKTINTLQGAIDNLNNQKSIIQKQIDLNQAKYDKLQKQIKETERKIDDNKDALGVTLADLYVDDTISPLEMLASSSNIGDYVDKQTYRSSMSDSLRKTINEINELKKELDTQKKAVEKTLTDQKNSRKALADKEKEKSSLLAQTQGKEASYQKLTSEKQAQKAAVQQQQQAAIEAAIRASSGGGSVSFLPGDPNKGGYPWGGNCYVDDAGYSHGGVYYPGAGGYNGLDGMGSDSAGSGAYGCGQCVSYAAWKVYQKTGEKWRGMGNANMWPGNAPRSSGSHPRKNSLGVISAGAYGHIVYIEDYYPSQGTVKISQYNYWNAGGPGYGHYSEMIVSASTYDTYIYL